MIIQWLIALGVPAKYARVIVIVIILTLLITAFTIYRSCTRHAAEKTVEAQATQTTKSGEAIAAAASNAVETVHANGNAEVAIDQATAVAKKEIGNAQDPAAVRAAVVRALCVPNSPYRNDPACKLR